MRRLIAAAAIPLLFLTAGSFANSVALQCSLSTSRYPGVDDSTQFQEVILTGLKDQVSGAVRVFTIKKLSLEFWAMNHTMIKQNENTKVMNYQLAVKNNENGQFIHSLSNDRTHDQQGNARLSLVSYIEDSMLEAGEIMFDCKEKL